MDCGCPADEYDPEGGELAAKLLRCVSVDDVLAMTHAVFCCWFGKDTAGPARLYRPLAESLWLLRERFGDLRVQDMADDVLR